MILPWVDYAKGSRVVLPSSIVGTITGTVKMRPEFTHQQLLALVAIDDEFLALDSGMARKFASAVNANWRHPWAKDVLDCDDQEALFRAERVKARRRAGFKKAEAFGGIDYDSMGRKGQHWASWAVVVENGNLRMKAYQPDVDEWQEPDKECGDVLFFDA